jgi:hypothetical protein
MCFGTSDHIFNIHEVQLIIIFISLTKYSPGCMVGVLMSVGVMTVGVMSVGVMTVGVMTVGVMRRPHFYVPRKCRKAHQIKRVCGTCYAHEFNLNVFRHE